MDEYPLPFSPIRDSLYTSSELSAGFDPGSPNSLTTSKDFLSYQYFVANGRSTPEHPYAGMMEALHDNSIYQALSAFLKGRTRVAAVMGGHREERGSDNYTNLAILAKRLTEAGFLMASGGGPGAMEATHLGASLRGHSEDALKEAISSLGTVPSLPRNASKVLGPSGRVDMSIVESLHEWAVPAHRLMSQLSDPGESLAVPTWQYGHEPFTPLASHNAKFFQNSVREDVLLYLAVQGIVFAPGRGGTVQEVFQDAAQNYYAEDESGFAPMVFYDADAFWTRTLPVKPMLEGLFALAGKQEQWERNVLFTADVDQIVEFLEARLPSPEERHGRAIKLGMLSLLKAQTGESS